MYVCVCARECLSVCVLVSQKMSERDKDSQELTGGGGVERERERERERESKYDFLKTVF